VKRALAGLLVIGIAACGGSAPPPAAEPATQAEAKATEPAKKDAEADTAIHRVPIGASPVRGRSDALVTIVEFGDFECPFTRRVEPTLVKLRERYGDQVRFVWKNEPLPGHGQSRPAAELAFEAQAEAGDAAFWAAHDAILTSTLEYGELDRIGRDVKLDPEKVRAALLEKRYAKRIEDDEALAKETDAGGTPHFFINGRRFKGARAVEDFAAVIDAALADARARVAKGTPADRVYDEIMREATGAAPEKK
jgi:protein-disulfide isomerase